MEGFTLVDGVIAAVIILSAILAYSRGLVREVLAIGVWIVAAIIAAMFAHQVQPLIRELPVIGDFLATSCEMSVIIAFFAVGVGVLVVASFFTPFFSSIVQKSFLGGLDMGLGFLFGAVRGILLVAVAFFFYETVITAQDIPMINDSRSASIFSQFTGKIEEQNPVQLLAWFEAQGDQLISVCEAPASTDS